MRTAHDPLGFKLSPGVSSSATPPPPPPLPWSLTTLTPCSVLNLSRYSLTGPEINLLTLGTKFVPKPTLQRTRHAVRSNFSLFRTKTLRAHFFSRHPPRNPTHTPFDPKSLPHRLKPPSEWTPAPNQRDPLLDHHLKQLFEDLLSIASRSDLSRNEPDDPHSKPPENFPIPNDNLSPSLRRAHHTLKRRVFRLRQIIIKPADKGSTLVVLNREDYLAEAHRQLAIERHYRPIPALVSNNSHPLAQRALTTLRKHKIITRQQQQFCLPQPLPFPARTRYFYLLPKIHKPPRSWPTNIPAGRPIVSDSGSDTNRICELVDILLTPLSTGHKAYIKDTPHLLSILSQTQVLPDDLLVTIDVSALYTNIDNQDAIRATRKQWLRTHHLPEDTWNQPDLYPVLDALTDLMTCCLEFNDFEFDGQNYLQVSGVAMGRRFAPRLADLFMDWLETDFMNTLPPHLLPSVYKRYLDDIFIVWRHGPQALQQFVELFNQAHHSIKFTHEADPQQVNFLDVTIFKGPDLHHTQRLSTRLYVKPTDTHQLLHTSSYHPPHTFDGIIKSQLIRYSRISSHRSDEDQATRTLAKVLTSQRGYNPDQFRKARNLLLLKQRRGWLPCNLPTSCPVCRLQPRHRFPILQVSHTHKHPSDHPLHNLPTTSTYHISSRTRCDRRGTIYGLLCTRCHTIYVGRTSNTLRERWSQHIHRMSLPIPPPNSQNLHHNTARLYNHARHCGGPQAFHPFPLHHFHPRDLQSAITLEAQIIQTLASSYTQGGLNQQTPSPQPLLPLVLPFSDSSSALHATAKASFRDLTDTDPSRYTLRPLPAHSRHQNLLEALSKAKVP